MEEKNHCIAFLKNHDWVQKTLALVLEIQSTSLINNKEIYCYFTAIFLVLVTHEVSFIEFPLEVYYSLSTILVTCL